MKLNKILLFLTLVYTANSFSMIRTARSVLGRSSLSSMRMTQSILRNWRFASANAAQNQLKQFESEKQRDNQNKYKHSNREVILGCSIVGGNCVLLILEQIRSSKEKQKEQMLAKHKIDQESAKIKGMITILDKITSKYAVDKVNTSEEIKKLLGSLLTEPRYCLSSMFDIGEIVDTGEWVDGLGEITEYNVWHYRDAIDHKQYLERRDDIKKLILRSSKESLEVTDTLGNPLINFLLYYDDFELVHILIKKGVNIDKKNKKGLHVKSFSRNSLMGDYIDFQMKS